MKVSLIAILTALLGFMGSSRSLQAQAPVYFIWQDTFCGNQIVLVNNNFYGPNNPSGTEILPGAASNGGDSIIQVEFTFFQPALTILEQDLCSGDTLWVNNQPYHAMRWLGEERIFGGALNGCDSIIQVRLTILPLPLLEITDTLCVGSTLTINGTEYGIDRPQGKEIVAGAGSQGCDSIIDIHLFFFPIQLDLGPDRTIGLGDTICLSAALNFQPTEMIWSPEPTCLDDDCLVACFSPVQETMLFATAMDPLGCEITDSVSVLIDLNARIYIPNAFKPDEGGMNGRFVIYTDNSIRMVSRFLIADRWGNILFERTDFSPNDESQSWDGLYKDRPMPAGVYVWLAEFITLDDRVIVKSGDVTLIR